MRFQLVLALLGYVTLAAAYSLPGAYERLLLYYTYRLDLLTHGTPEIATGCPGKGGNPCTLEEFIKYINHGELVVEDAGTSNGGKVNGGKGNKGGKGTKVEFSLPTEDLPDVKETAKILMEKKITGQIDPQKVVKGTKGDYPALFKRIGEFIVGKWSANPIKGTEPKIFQKVKDGAFEAMVAVRNARMEAAVDSFEPGFEVVKVFDQLGGAAPNTKEMAKKNGLKKAEVDEMFREHIKGAHQENIKYLRQSVEVIACSKQQGRRRGLGCGDAVLEESYGKSEISSTGGSETSPSTEGGETVPEPVNPGEKVPEPVNPGAEPGTAGPPSPESVELAERVSGEEFTKLSRGMLKSVSDTLQYSIKDIRTKALGYKPLTPKSPSFKLGATVNGGLAIAGIGFWIKGMVDAFKNDVNILDKTAAVTSIIPFAGCSANLASQAWKGDIDGQDTALCYMGDALLFTPLAPLGVAIHLIRWFVSALKAPPVPEKEAFVQQRDSEWERFLGDHVYTYIYSDSTEDSNSTEKSFRAKLNSSLSIQELAVISEGAQRIGVLTALGQNALKTSANETEKTELENGIAKIRAAVRNETVLSQRAYLLDLPDTLREKTKASLKPMAEAFNKDYIGNITSIQMATHYYRPDVFKGTRPGASAFGVKPGNLAQVEAQLNSIGAHLKTQPLPLPKTFTLACIIGQSKGLAGLDPLVLSPRDYLRDQIEPKLSEDRINFFSLFHSVEVAKLLQGSLKEDELRNPWKSDIKDARPLHLLIAMKFGKLFDEQRESRDGRPEIPPIIGRDLGNSASLAAVTGLSEEIVQNLPKDGQFLRYKELVSEKMVLAMQELLEQRAKKAAQAPPAKAEI